MPESALVLVVDDHEDTAAATALILEREGYRISTASDGRQGLDLIKKLRPAVTLLDVMLPDISGLEVLSQVRADPDLASCAIVMFSARATGPEEQAAALDAGADGYIPKPVPAQELLARVRKQVRQRELTDALRASEARYADLLEASHDLIWAVDAGGRITFLNRACRTIFGREPEEMVGRSFLEFLPAGEAERDAAMFNQILQSGTDTFGYTIRVTAKDGQEVILNSNVRVLRDAEGRVVGRTGFSRDITEHQRASERERTLAMQLAEERARLVAAQAVAKVGSWHTDLVTLSLTWSAETYRIFEMDPAHFNQTYAAFLDRVHPDDREFVDRALMQSLNQRTPSTIEHRILVADDRVKRVEERWLVSHDDEGRPISAIGTCRDITDQKAAEERIHHLNRVYAILSEIGHAIVREKDADHLLQAACRIAVEKGDFKMAWIAMPGPDGRLAIAAHAGASPDTLEIIERVLQDEPQYSLARRAFMTGQPQTSNDVAHDPRVAEWRVAALRRGYRSMASLPLIAEGRTVGTLNLGAEHSHVFDEEEMRLLNELASDIAFALGAYRRDSERRLAEAALRESDIRLRESISEVHALSTRLNDVREQERARMARDIHDHLGQALTALKLDVAEVKRRVKSGDAAAVDERLTEMASVIDGTINDVRRVAAELRPVILDDLGFVLAIKAHLQDVARRSHLRCVLHTDLPDLPIAADRATALYRILQEALTNVIRHAGASRVDVSLSVDATSVVLVVHDDGTGIHSTERVDPRAIGLVGMRDRARLFGGTVVVTGAPGEGTTVSARLPLR